MPESNLRPQRRNAVWFVSQMFLRAVFHLWNGYKARGWKEIAPGGGLLLANHQSFLDPLLIGLPLSRPICYLARETLFRVPLLGLYLRRVYVMPLNREGSGADGIRQGVGRMREGFLVGVFPEGARSYDGRMQELKPGFVALVRRAGVPVYPVGIAGAHDALPRGSKWLRPRPIRVVFGKRFTPDELTGRPEEITQRAEARIAACVAEAEGWLRGEASDGKMEQTPTGEAPIDSPEHPRS